MNEPMVNFRVLLVVWGFHCRPEAVSAALGTEPTKTWRRGTPRGPGVTAVHDENGWSIEADVAESTDVESHVRRLLDRLPNGLDSVRQLDPLARASVEIVLYCDRDAPRFILDSAVVRRLAVLGLELSVDVLGAGTTEP